MSAPSLAVAFGPMPLADAMLLRAGLRVSGVEWRTVAREACDVFFAVNLNDLPPAGQGSPRCVVAGPRRASAVPAIFLDRWPSITQMPDVIRLLGTSRSRNAALATARATAPSHGAATVDQWLADLARTEAADRLLHVTAEGAPVALLDAANRCAWLAPSAASDLVSALRDAKLVALPVPRSQAPSTAIRASLAHFLWAMALANTWAPDALGIEPARRLKLRRWPDFGSLERRDTFLRVASKLTREPTSLQSLIATFPSHKHDVLVFLAGCRLCGWLEVTADMDQSAPPAPAALPGRMSLAIGALRRALGMPGTSR